MFFMCDGSHVFDRAWKRKCSRETARKRRTSRETMPSPYMKWLEAKRPIRPHGWQSMLSFSWRSWDMGGGGLLLGFWSHVTCHRVREQWLALVSHSSSPSFC